MPQRKPRVVAAAGGEPEPQTPPRASAPVPPMAPTRPSRQSRMFDEEISSFLPLAVRSSRKSKGKMQCAPPIPTFLPLDDDATTVPAEDYNEEEEFARALIIYEQRERELEQKNRMFHEERRRTGMD